MDDPDAWWKSISVDDGQPWDPERWPDIDPNRPTLHIIRPVEPAADPSQLSHGTPAPSAPPGPSVAPPGPSVTYSRDGIRVTESLVPAVPAPIDRGRGLRLILEDMLRSLSRKDAP